MITKSHPPAYRFIADSIRDDIRARRLVPGDRLPSELDLASRFGVSRPTVREAIRELASLHLVQTSRGSTGGTFVVVPRAAEVVDTVSTAVELLAGTDALTVADMLEARELLEIPAVRLAAVRRSDQQLASILDCLHRLDEPAAVDSPSNWTFHALLVNAANNPLIDLAVGPVFGVLQNRFAPSQASSRHRTRVADDHRLIVAAITDGDAEAAAAAMRAHLEFLRPVYRPLDTRLGRG